MGQSLWYLSRGTGLVCLLLVTASVVLGLLTSGRRESARWPRFVVVHLHRNLSLLTVLFLVVHVASAIIDPYAGIRWIDAVLPFASSYHPLEVGLGALALDLMVAVIVTSLLRDRVPHRWWRGIHLASYALWPVVVVHGLRLAPYDSSRTWVLVLYVLCGVAVTVALVVRLRGARAAHPDTRARLVDATRWR